MDANAEHAFPLPDIEQHKLDEMKDEIRQQPLLQRASGAVRANSWLVVSLAGFVGLLFGFWVARNLES